MPTVLFKSRLPIPRPVGYLQIAAPVTRPSSVRSSWPPQHSSLTRQISLSPPLHTRLWSLPRSGSSLQQHVRWLSDGKSPERPKAETRPSTGPNRSQILENPCHVSASTASERPMAVDSPTTGNGRPVADNAVNITSSSLHTTNSAPPIHHTIPPSGQGLPAPEPLPSEHLSRRSYLSARFNSYMEKLLNSLALLSQRVNIYTGTDYSGISALRSSITSQENVVRSLYDAVTQAKEAHSSALSAQAASHKEVVQLLERKHSWSDGDLEQYMALVRSEHLNEQAVQTANETVLEAERSLEEGRVTLEKIERKQYHEEQIWSDTIRRNSTWVTFGLMGFNILLLLASLVAIEPWRRKRMVTEIRSVLDESSLASRVNVTEGSSPGVAAVAGENLPLSAPQPFPSSKIDRTAEPTTPATLSSDKVAQVAELNTPDPIPEILKSESTAPHPPKSPNTSAEGWSKTFARWNVYRGDLFSERRIELRRVDLTAATLEGAAAGAAFMGLLFVLLRPR